MPPGRPFLFTGRLISDNYRYRYGETNPTFIPQKSGVAVSIGDLCWIDDTDGNTLKPASAFAFSSAGFGQTQVNFAAKFVGVNAQRWDGTNQPTGSKDGNNRVDTSGVFEFDCAAGSTFYTGDLVGPDNSGGSTLMNQQVVKVADMAHAVARVQEPVTNGNKVKVRIISQRMGVFVNATI